MKAAIVDRFGAAPRFGTFAEPLAEAGETLVAVTHASIKQLDRAIVSGTHYSSPRTLPMIPGTDGVGRRADGTPVYFMAGRTPFGAMAENAPATLVVPLPEGIDHGLAAAVVNPALGAWLPLAWRGHVAPGETVLILGATGATGSLAVRAARLLGAGRVIAAGRRPDALAALDADATIDLRLPPADLRAAFAQVAASGIDVVVDYVWGAPAELLIAELVRHDLATDAHRRAIRYVSVGAMAGATIALPSAALRGSQLTILGSGTANFPPAARLADFVGDILGRASAGEIGLPVAEHPLADVARCWAAPGDGPRIVLRIA